MLGERERRPVRYARGMSEPALSRQDRTQILVAWAGWVVLAAVMAALVYGDPVGRSVTPNYRDAARAFMDSAPMYKPGAQGWLYLPSSAVLYVPFMLGPVWLGEVGYRIVITALYAWALWQVAVLASPRRLGDYFPAMTLLAMPLAAGAIRNGQMNIPLGASMALATAAMAAGRGWVAASWLALGWLTKPLGLILALLAGALKPRWIAPIGLSIIVATLLPFANLNWTYVAQIQREGVAKVFEAAGPTGVVYADLGGLLNTLGIDPPRALMTAIRVVAAFGTLALSWLALRRFATGQGWIIVFTLASAYLMLFNPRTEGVSYPILMPGLAALTCWAVFRDRVIGRSALLLVICVVMAAAHVVSKGGDVALRPAATLVLLGLLAADVLRARPVPTPPAPSPAAVH